MKTSLRFPRMVALIGLVAKNSLCSWCLQLPATCQRLCPSSPGHCQHLHLKHFSVQAVQQVFLFLLSLVYFLVQKHQGFTELFDYCFSVENVYSLQYNISEQGAPNLLSAVPHVFFSPTAAAEQLPWFPCFLTVLSSCHFST